MIWISLISTTESFLAFFFFFWAVSIAPLSTLERCSETVHTQLDSTCQAPGRPPSCGGISGCPKLSNIFCEWTERHSSWVTLADLGLSVEECLQLHQGVKIQLYFRISLPWLENTISQWWHNFSFSCKINISVRRKVRLENILRFCCGILID